MSEKEVKKSLVRKSLKTEEKENVKQLILSLTEEQTYSKYSDANLDKENEKIELLSGEFITIGDINRVVATSVQPYSPIFKISTGYYQEIYRLNGWPEDDATKYVKKSIVAKYTNQLIYDRFSNEILPILQGLNPYVRYYVRKFKHFQFLTLEAREKVELYVAQAVGLMKECDDWYEFRKKYYHKYGGSIQLNAFEDNSDV